MNRSIRQLLSITLVLLLTGAPMLAQRRGGGTRTSVSQGNVNRNAHASQGNINRNTNINSNRNVNVNVDHDVYVHGGYYGGGCCYHPVATAAAVTATAMVTAAVIGSMVYTLPPACSVVIVNGFTYQHCGSVWYQPQFVGTSTTYVVVAAPQ
ncbi:MAG TPA: hypothetical protein VMI10_14960 [Terriglobales bacterium]|nr:hypothetical protein [Terriglobales bacterium]